MGWACDLLPMALVVAGFFAAEQAALARMGDELDALDAQIADLEEEHSGDDGVFADFDKINAKAVKERLEEIDSDAEADDERPVLQRWQDLDGERAALKKQRKEANTALDGAALAKYSELTAADIRALVVDDKWLANLQRAIAAETESSGQQLTARVRELAERYVAPLPQLAAEVETMQAKVDGHLERMGFAWT
jgi:type I restriction enzyme M protein